MQTGTVLGPEVEMGIDMKTGMGNALGGKGWKWRWGLTMGGCTERHYTRHETA